MFGIFKSPGSLGRSILTVEDEEEISDDSPVSIIAIAKKYNLNKLVVIDDSFLSFPKLYKTTNKHNLQLIFGINFILCNDVNDKTDKSLNSEHKVSVLMKNSKGYKDLIKLHDAINSNVDNFYYNPRGDCNTLLNNWSENLELLIPPFDNFIQKNYLENGTCLPNFNKIKPLFTISKMELPWNEILNEKIVNYCKNNNYQLQEVHPIYYYKQSDFKSYSIFRSIDNRGKFMKPNIPYFCSDKFSFEEFCKKEGVKFND